MSMYNGAAAPQSGNRGGYGRAFTRGGLVGGRGQAPENGQSSRGGPSFGYQPSRGGSSFGNQPSRGGYPFDGESSRGRSNGYAPENGSSFNGHASRGGSSFGRQAPENGPSYRGDSSFDRQAPDNGSSFGGRLPRGAPFGNQPSRDGESSRGRFNGHAPDNGSSFNGHASRGGRSGGTFYNSQAFQHNSVNGESSRGRFNGHAPDNGSSFGRSSRGASRAYPVATIIPDGNVEFQPTQPVPLPVHAEDKEEFGEEIGTKLASHTIPRTHAEIGFAPKTREVSDIYNEDEKHADEYATIIDEDDDVEITGLEGSTLLTIDNWAAASFHEKLYENIKRAKYIRPRKIQSSAIPIILDNYDLRVKAETGSGKTLTFLLPIIDECMSAKRDNKFGSGAFSPYAVILGPTRELVIQTFEQACKLADGTGVSVARAYGEYNVKKNQKELNIGCDILCATPGRFLHFVQEKYIKLDKIRFLVFDEADKLLTDDFQKTIDAALFDHEPKLSDAHQTLFFSATFEDELMKNAEKYMRPGFIASIKSNNSAPTKKVHQEFRLREKHRFDGIRSFFVEELAKVNGDATKLPRTFIFCQTGQYSERLAVALEGHGVPAIPLNGLRGQDLREEALRSFRENKATVLICTDLVARGIDIKDADLVINCDMPEDFDTYVHRVGRCGRIRHGRCISYVSRETDRPLLLKIKQVMAASAQIIPPSLEEVLGSPEKEDNSTANEVGNKAEESVSIQNLEEMKPEVPENVADVSTPEAEEEKEPEIHELVDKEEGELASSEMKAAEKQSDADNEVDVSPQQHEAPPEKVEEMKPDEAKLDGGGVTPEQAKLPREDDDEDDW